MKIGAMNHPARNLLEQIDSMGQQGIDNVDSMPELPPKMLTKSTQWRSAQPFTVTV